MANKTINVQGTEITVASLNEADYISLTDMAKRFGNSSLVEMWLRNKDTLEFLAVWEKINNPDFNLKNCDVIKQAAGLNKFYISVKRWIEQTNSIGVIATAGRYGKTIAHKEIALEFCCWLSPEFKAHFIKVLTSSDLVCDISSEMNLMFVEKGGETSIPSFVYVMKDQNNDYVKIGKSNNPRYREKTLQSEQPSVELIKYKKFLSVKRAYSFEKDLHRKFNSYKIRGEWFDLAKKEYLYLLTLFDEE